ncbi:acyltransferase family protein [Nocardioides panacisoli]|uniref:acyltransferase family protein n=1 Tax=Nocardioides panacisoli TaxID=627624 RepID=UPI001C63AF70|nr:acyltransferase family protein [Nocardioides panacisoli]QYJ04410.1 acyltransferase family protein [Nocardioides panacisoli]
MSAPTASRDPWFDNAKMALVTLVVIGHVWAVLPQTALTRNLYDFVYLWHMPAFVLVAGYLSRSFDYSPRRLRALVRTVAVPYLVFEGLLALYRTQVGGEEMENLFLDPHWPMWFLVALFCWRLMTPVFRSMPGAVPVAVLLSLSAGMWASSDTLDVARIFGLLPFFVIGLVATPERFEALRGQAPRVLALVAFAAIALVSANTDRFASTEWLYYRTAYDDMGAADDQGMLTRLALLGIGLVGALACLALMPRRDGWFARMGSASIVVYLVHGFAVKTAVYAGFGGWSESHPWLGLLLGTAGAILVALFLAWSPVTRRLEVLVDPVGSWQRLRTRRREARREPERDEGAPVAERV